MGKFLNDTNVEFVMSRGSHVSVEGEKKRMLEQETKTG